MSERKTCGRCGSADCEADLDLSDCEMLFDCAERTAARAKVAEAKLAAVQLAVEEIEVAYWDEDVPMMHYIQKALKAIDGGETK